VKDYRASIEKLRADAAEAALIRDLVNSTTDHATTATVSRMKLKRS
jgi:hypothetical protein